jgi:transcriptional regulator with XRE-family HTH domain
MSLTKQLKQAVKQSNLTTYAVAKGAGVPVPTLSRFLRGERDIRLATADKLAAFFQMHLTRPKRPKRG